MNINNIFLKSTNVYNFGEKFVEIKYKYVLDLENLTYVRVQKFYIYQHICGILRMLIK